jgi:hypothetical protein
MGRTHTNIAERKISFNLNIKDEVMRKILDCFKVNQVATIWGTSQSNFGRVLVEKSFLAILFLGLQMLNVCYFRNRCYQENCGLYLFR